MIAMALGNIYGGRSADRHPDPARLYARILLAAVWIGAIPVVGKYIVLGISAVLVFSVSSNFLIVAAFVACMVIFVFCGTAGDGDALPGKIHCGQPSGERQDGGEPGGL